MINFREWNVFFQVIAVFIVLIAVMAVLYVIFNPPPEPEIVEVYVDGYINFDQFLKGFNFPESYQRGCPTLVCTNNTVLSFWGNMTYRNGIVEQFPEGRSLYGYFEIQNIDYFPEDEEVAKLWPRFPFKARFIGEIRKFGPDIGTWIKENLGWIAFFCMTCVAVYLLRRKVVGPTKQVGWAANRVKEEFESTYGGRIIGEIFGEKDNEINPTYYKMYFEGDAPGFSNKRFRTTVNFHSGAVGSFVPMQASMQQKLFEVDSLPFKEEIEKSRRTYTESEVESARREGHDLGFEMGKSQTPKKRSGFMGRKQVQPEVQPEDREE